MGPVVDTTYGELEGREREGLLLFVGVPFAAPPVGPLRFRPPEPHPGWSGARDATAFGPVSVQSAGPLELLAGGGPPDWSEDCLTLNVVTPGLDDAHRPVMVWIHGGGFTSGAGSIPWYDGSSLAQRGDVVVVSINYRLGALGWLHLEHLDADFARSSNAGLLDQIAALEWVRDNIAAFGGDPGNVTIFGESAGAMSVGTLLGTPEAAGLFHKAIAQSGAAHNTCRSDEAIEVTDALCAAAGVSDVEALCGLDAAALLEAQTAASLAITKARARSEAGAGLGLPFGPVVDGHVLPTAPIDAVRAGSASTIPLLIGTTAEEWKLFALALSSVRDEETIMRRLGRMVADPHEIAAAYRQQHGEASHDDLWTAILTDRIFRIPAIRLAEAQSDHQPDHTFMYLFEWATPAFDGRLGSCHALEIPFVFDNLDRRGVEMFTGPDAPQHLADVMSEAWLAFARAGDPNHAGLDPWPAYERVGRATMHFAERSRVERDPGPESRAAWDGVL